MSIGAPQPQKPSPFWSALFSNQTQDTVGKTMSAPAPPPHTSHNPSWWYGGNSFEAMASYVQGIGWYNTATTAATTVAANTATTAATTVAAIPPADTANAQITQHINALNSTATPDTGVSQYGVLGGGQPRTSDRTALEITTGHGAVTGVQLQTPRDPNTPHLQQQGPIQAPQAPPPLPPGQTGAPYVRGSGYVRAKDSFPSDPKRPPGVDFGRCCMLAATAAAASVLFPSLQSIWTPLLR